MTGGGLGFGNTVEDKTSVCKHCNEPIEYMTDCVDTVNRWMHIGTTDADDPYGQRPTRYLECRKAVATPSNGTGMAGGGGGGGMSPLVGLIYRTGEGNPE